MKLRLLLVVGMSAICGAGAAVPDPTFGCGANGEMEKLVIPGDLLRKSPSADPEKGSLPLSFDRACSLAVSAVVEFPETNVDDIELKPMPAHGENKWIYVVTVRVNKERRKRHVAVLMNGTVIRGVMEDR